MATQLVSTWEELAAIPPSETHKLEIDLVACNGWIVPLSGEKTYDNSHYLSTHTFYGKNYAQSTALLRSCGFNVQLKNWG